MIHKAVQSIKYIVKALMLRKIAFLFLDLLSVYAALSFALYVRFDGLPPERHALRAQEYVPVFLVLAIGVFFVMQFYKHLWQYASTAQYVLVLLGTLIQTALIVALMLVQPPRLPWSVYFLYWLFATLFMLATRLIYRQLYRYRKTDQTVFQAPLIRSIFRNGLVSDDRHIKKILVYGAGRAGYLLVRDLLENPRDKVPVTFIDDNLELRNQKILGLKVFGGRDKLQEAVDAYHVDMIIIAIPSADQASISQIIDLASETGCEVKIVPQIDELIDGKVSFSQVREIDIADLLGREEIRVDIQEIGSYLNQQTVLVTGGGGSIGSELCRQIARFNPRKIVVFDIYENNAYQLENEIKLTHGDKVSFQVLIGSVRDIERLQAVFESEKPNIVFHAAAHKHVPLMEDSPGEAVKNNVLGTYNVARQAGLSGVRNMVLISTDKAVNPTNVMGATKRLAEMIIQNMSRQFPQTLYAAVRFGNVLGSNGSVIPLFQNQIRFQQKVTVTHPDITRYFMTIPEAVRLVIQAGTLARGGEIFVLDMGKPVKILDLAKNLIRLNGFEPDVDIKIEFTGLRPGEKMYEELYLNREQLIKTRHEKIFVLSPITDEQHLNAEIDQLKVIIRTQNDKLDNLLSQVVLT